MSDRSLPLAIAERAMHWQLELQEHPQDAHLLSQCQAWRQQHPLHEEAWRRAQALASRLTLLREPAHSEVTRHALAHRLQRRQVLKHMAVLLAAGTGAWSMRDSGWVQGALSDYHSGVGEQRTLGLNGGIRVQLNTDSAIDLREAGGARRILLRQGELVVETPTATGNPLQVQTRDGLLEPLGNRVAVRLWPHETQVTALDGSTRITPSNAAPLLLGQGQTGRFDSAGLRRQGPALSSELAWRHGMLVADGLPLGDFLRELGRYRRGHLGCDTALAQRPVSGTFPLADTDRVLAAVSQTLDLRVAYFSRFWVTLQRA